MFYYEEELFSWHSGAILFSIIIIVVTWIQIKNGKQRIACKISHIKSICKTILFSTKKTTTITDCIETKITGNVENLINDIDKLSTNDNNVIYDQPELYISTKIPYIIDELIQTEANYIKNLLNGWQNYGYPEQCKELPDQLNNNEKWYKLLGNIYDIYQLHEQMIYPLMIQNKSNLKCLFDLLTEHINENHFYCYVTFIMNKKISLQLRQENHEWIQSYQRDINDKLGIDSFLLQPIQRLTKYPLLLQQIISEFYKNNIVCKPILQSLCRLETRMRKLLEMVNQAEEISDIENLNPDLNIENMGNFHYCAEFEISQQFGAYRHSHVKMFLFDFILLKTEIRKKHLIYRRHYDWKSVELQLISSKTIRFVIKKPILNDSMDLENFKNLKNFNDHKDFINRNITEKVYILTSVETNIAKKWLSCTRHIIEKFNTDNNNNRIKSKCSALTFSINWLIGILFILWFLWQYL